MSRKKKHEHVNHERWLVSYADFITLLFAFFVVLFASGQSDKKKQQKFASAFEHAFSQMALFSPASKRPSLNDSSGANPDAEPKPIELPIAEAKTGDAPKPAEVKAKLDEVMKREEKTGSLKSGDVDVRSTPEGLTVSLREGGFFGSGSAELRPAAANALAGVASALAGQTIRVEGHTDNVPMRSALYASNWELSSARAAAIGRFLLEHSTLEPAKLSVAGYAEFHPVASNATAEGRAKNRRVDVVFLQAAPVASQQGKPGFETRDSGRPGASGGSRM